MEQGGLVWQSLTWRDGTRYSGLTKDGKMHCHGILTFPNNDRYEGEFEDGNMHGSGVYVWGTGMIYRGDWMQGAMHGCGARIWKQPDGSMAAAEGTFFHDEYVGDIMPCSKEDAFDNAVEADMAAFQARSFQWPSRQAQSQSRQQRAAAHDRQLQARAGTQTAQPAQLHPQPGTKAGPHARWPTGSSMVAAPQPPGVHNDQRQDQRLQSLVQRLVADRMAGQDSPP